MQFAAGDLARPLIEGGARLGAGFDEVAGRPAIAAGLLVIVPQVARWRMR
jgi:hypothetical protein